MHHYIETAKLTYYDEKKRNKKCADSSFTDLDTFDSLILDHLRQLTRSSLAMDIGVGTGGGGAAGASPLSNFEVDQNSLCPQQ